MTKLYQFQKASVGQIIVFRGRALLALEMGLGKTLVSLDCLRRCPQLLPALVVCPASAKWVWKDETRRHTRFSGRVLSGKMPSRFTKPKDITIINYDILPTWTDTLIKMGFRTLILDECQYIKTWRAKRTKAAVRLGKRMRGILALSGTPLTNRPKELYTTLHLLLPQQFRSFVPYAFRYCHRRHTPWGWDDTGASHLDELHDILTESCMIRYTKKQVLHELPPKRRFVVPLPMSPGNTEYQKAENDFVNWLENEVGQDKAQHAQKATTLVKLGYLKRLAAQGKLTYVIEWIENFLEETDEKLVVFAYHRYIIDKLHRKFPSAVILDGRTTQKQRPKIVRRFQRDDNTRLFIGQITAAGTAITLTAASTCMFAELDWVPGNHIQAEDRLHRIGQRNHVQAYYLVARGTIEEKLCKIIQKKAGVITAILDGKQQRNEMDVFDQLVKNYTK